MAAHRKREPVVQMRQTLVVAKTVGVLDERVVRIEALMLARGMKPLDASKRLTRALPLAGGAIDWTFEIAWAIGWETIYWPHRTPERHFEQELLSFCRTSFEAAWHKRPPTPIERVAAAFDALADARDTRLYEGAGAAVMA